MGEIERRQSDRPEGSEARMADEHFQQEIDRTREGQYQEDPTERWGEEYVPEYQVTFIVDVRMGEAAVHEWAENVAGQMLAEDDTSNIRHDIAFKPRP